MSEPREWWLRTWFQYLRAFETNKEGGIHVVEYAALEAARAEIEQWQVERDIRVKAMEEQQREIERLKLERSYNYEGIELHFKKQIEELKLMAENYRARLLNVANVASKHATGKTEYEATDWDYVLKEASKALPDEPSAVGKSLAKKVVEPDDDGEL